MKTVGYRGVTNGHPIAGMFFPNPLLDGAGNPIPGQQEAVLRSDAEERINILETQLSATPDMEHLQVEIINLKGSLSQTRAVAAAALEDCDKWVDKAREAARQRDKFWLMLESCGFACGLYDGGAQDIVEAVHDMAKREKGNRFVRALRIILTGK